MDQKAHTHLPPDDDRLPPAPSQQLLHVTQYHENAMTEIGTAVIVEQSVSLTVNGKLWLSFMCTPTDLEALAVGFLYNENVITSKDEIEDIYVCAQRDNVDIWLNRSVDEPRNWRRTSGCTGGYSAVVLEEVQPVPPDDIRLTPEEVLTLMGKLFASQDMYRKTGGVHSSAFANPKEVIFQLEDVGRHNTLDKIAGKILLDEIDVPERILLTTGRISSEMLQKAARMKISMLISLSSPTSMSIDLAERLGVTLVGYARGGKFNLYCHPERIIW